MRSKAGASPARQLRKRRSVAAEATGPNMPLELSEEESDGAAAARARYSPVGVESSEPPEVSKVDDAWIAAARALVRRVQLGPSRKWRAAVKGRRFDVRRTLRASLQTGGELLAARWLIRPRRRPRFIVLVDGSRSISQHAGTALTLASALVRATPRVEVFTFSTALQRVTTDVQRAAIVHTHRFRPLASAWGGGTTIGACLAEFVQRFGDRLLTASTGGHRGQRRTGRRRAGNAGLGDASASPPILGAGLAQPASRLAGLRAHCARNERREAVRHHVHERQRSGRLRSIVTHTASPRLTAECTSRRDGNHRVTQMTHRRRVLCRTI